MELVVVWLPALSNDNASGKHSFGDADLSLAKAGQQMRKESNAPRRVRIPQTRLGIALASANFDED
jgi:hypothetical protein